MLNMPIALSASLVALASLAAQAAGPANLVPGPAELALAKKFAPIVVLAQGEPYLPSSIEFYAPHVTLQCKGANAKGSVLAVAGTLPDPGAQQSNCFLTTNEKMKGPDHILAFFKGQAPSAKSPVPVYVSFYRSAKNGALNIQYLTFYPYNWGKNVCLSLAPRDHCMAKRHQMDNHVGDWEGMTIQVQNDQLVGVRVGAHSASTIGFTYLKSATGKCADEGGSGDLNKVSPLSCIEVRSGHPVVYSAWGSHGIWGKPGNHNYNTLPTGERLNDSTTKGIEWHTDALQVVADPTKYPFLYRGRWGNSHETAPNNRNACKLSPVPHKLCTPAGIPTDEYEMNDGPVTPDYNRDFEKL
jgi:hypothetical protein